MQQTARRKRRNASAIYGGVNRGSQHGNRVKIDIYKNTSDLLITLKTLGWVHVTIITTVGFHVLERCTQVGSFFVSSDNFCRYCPLARIPFILVVSEFLYPWLACLL